MIKTDYITGKCPEDKYNESVDNPIEFYACGTGVNNDHKAFGSSSCIIPDETALELKKKSMSDFHKYMESNCPVTDIVLIDNNDKNKNPKTKWYDKPFNDDFKLRFTRYAGFHEVTLKPPKITKTSWKAVFENTNTKVKRVEITTSAEDKTATEPINYGNGAKILIGSKECDQLPSPVQFENRYKFICDFTGDDIEITYPGNVELKIESVDVFVTLDMGPLTSFKLAESYPCMDVTDTFSFDDKEFGEDTKNNFQQTNEFTRSEWMDNDMNYKGGCTE